MPKVKELAKAYNAKEVEDRIYKLWEKSGFFAPEKCIEAGITKNEGEVFSIVLPPPNVTGTLHMGHAAMLAIEDVLVRYNRMRGKKTLWIPGTDHAAIATESKVAEILYKKEGKTRNDLGREEFLKRVEQFAKESHDTIIHQIKKMGASLDWSREAYTLDEQRSLAVRTAFKRMYDAGLIYRGERIVNWDPKMQTTVSDDEVEWKEEQTKLYHLKYGPFIIVTARPETKFGDKYVVMHPDDLRYKEYQHGKKIQLEWINGPVTATIIKDKVVDMKFGTGVMTITPWHDMVDFDIAERHKLDKEQIINEKGKLLPIAQEFAGMHISKARLLIVDKLKQKGLLVRVDENYMHRIATNSRGNGIIEPQIMRQWFVNVNEKFKVKNEKTTLKELMLRVVKSGQITIVPKRFEKMYYHWIQNLRDWCISRQIWFGHQIPVWYRGEEIYVGIEPPKGEGWLQDPDTLDTWFSSGLWTFSTLGWPEKTKDLKTYHPTSVLETGYDILFFWVARMILMSGYLLGDIPFKAVYLHGLVRDAQGRKMSKSLGNIVDPLDMIQKYGADATRLSLLIGAAPGNDMKLSEDKVRGYRNFANKLWNVTRFVLLNTQDLKVQKKSRLTQQDKKILSQFQKIGKQVTIDIEQFRFSHAAETLYHYLWHTFADKIIEDSKSVLEDAKKKNSRQFVLLSVLQDFLKLAHPFIPFVTEEIYQQLPAKNKQKMLMIEQWPV